MTRLPCANMALLFSSALAAVAVIELLLAWSWPQTAARKQYHEQYHPIVGWANKPNVRGAVSLNPYQDADLLPKP